MTSVEDLFPNIKENSTSETTKRLYAVLQAITDLIKFKKAPITPTSYFALILTTLNEKTYKESQKQDLIKLFSTILQRVPPQIVKSKSMEIIEIMRGTLDKYTGVASNLSNTQFSVDDQMVIKSSIYCLGYVLVLAENQQWQLPEFLRSYSSLLTLAIYQHSKIRQKATEQIIFILNSVGAISSQQKGSILHKQLASVSSSFSHEIFSTITMDTMAKSYFCLNIVNEFLSLLPPSMISLLIEDMIKLTTYANSSLTSACYKAIGSLFFKSNSLSGMQIQQIIDVLYQFPPPPLDLKSAVSYTDLLSQAYLYFTKLDRKLCNQHIHKYFTTLMNNFGSDKTDITNATMDGFRGVIFDCINEDVIAQATNNSQAKSPLHIIIETLESGLRIQFKPSWDQILLIIQALYEQLGPHAYPLLNQSLINMDALFHSPDFHYQAHIHQVYITVFQCIGPKNFLSILPLNLDSPPHSKERVNRNWLLPLLRDNIKYTNLSFFIEYFLPLANDMKTKARNAEGEGLYVEARNLDILYSQVWDLLPGFLNHPVDADQSFKLIARNLGTLLTEEVGLRNTLCTSLSLMINRLKETETTKPLPFVPLRKSYHNMTQERAKELLKSVAIFSRNYLPILFNIFPTSNQDQRYFIINAIESFVSITDSATLNSIFKSLITKLLEALAEEGINKKGADAKMDTGMTTAEKKKTKKYYLTDLTLGFVKHLDEENIKVLYKVIKPQLKCSDTGLQKRSYKILVKICEHHESFILQNMHKIKSLLVSDIMQSPSNIKKNRLKCLKEIITSLSANSKKQQQQQQQNQEQEDDADDEEETNDSNNNTDKATTGHFKIKTGWTQLKTKFIPSMIPEIILCTKETNIKCREISNELLIELGKIMCIISMKLTKPKRGVPMEETEAIAHTEAIQEYIQLIMAGLASLTTHMVSASIVSIARIVHYFRDCITEEFVDNLFKTLMILLASPNRDVVKAVFGFVRVVIASYRDSDLIQPHLEMLINGLAKWGSIDKNYFRVIIQILLDRLIKKYGFEAIYELVPEDFKKVITNMKKKKERQEKLKEQAKEEGHSAYDDSKSQRDYSDNEDMIENDSDDDANRASDDDDADIEEFLFNVKKKNKKDEANWIIKEGDEPLDFMDRNVMNHLKTKTSTGPSTTAKGHKIKENPFETDGDGRMVIESSDDEKDANGRKRRKSHLEQVFEEQEEQYERKAGYRQAKMKSLLKQQKGFGGGDDDSDEEDDIFDDLKSSYTRRTARTTKTTKTAKTTRTTGGHSTKSGAAAKVQDSLNLARIDNANARFTRVRGIETNATLDRDYKSQKGGDNRKSNQKYEPFAYIKLDPKLLNKRSKGKSSEPFKKIIKKRKL
ncbi:hypothetical protein CYY_000065 [Polysphondylium violaceum]|uniref:Ribosomal RNA-processing protein 12-like conserved domain-containing protein n=1 Tax=Polysphondylium violaceum TaxID=133409 RepID=A0A8J4Q4I2_9MYCE|nr:hypothetical protein CYY_000065 [Polysphondylium violaceum]